MPKGKKKGKENQSRREREVSSEDESLNDNFSEHSTQSDLRSHDDECEEGPEGGAGSGVEDKVSECVDLLSAKAAATRTSALTALRTALERRYVPHVLRPHRASLAELLARALRKGKTPERRAAAALMPLLALQVGEEGSEEFWREVRPALLATALDGAADGELRIECCASVSVLCLLLEEDVSEVVQLLDAMETVFSGSYLKGDGSVKVSGAAVAAGAVHAAALDGWALLLPLLPSEYARARVVGGQARPNLAHLTQLLEACALEVRLSAAGALAVVTEHVCEGDDTAHEAVRAALPLLAELARDSNKYRAKRDRKTQRATCRDILRYLEEGETPCDSVTVGAESVALSSWAERAAYGALAGALGAGLQTCVPHHAALRAALGLPDAPPPPLHPKHLKHDKIQRQLQNAAAFKARTISRGKNRDKRSAVLAL